MVAQLKFELSSKQELIITKDNSLSLKDSGIKELHEARGELEIKFGKLEREKAALDDQHAAQAQELTTSIGREKELGAKINSLEVVVQEHEDQLKTGTEELAKSCGVIEDLQGTVLKLETKTLSFQDIVNKCSILEGQKSEMQQELDAARAMIQSLTTERNGLKDSVLEMKAAVETVQSGFIQAQATQAMLGEGILNASKLFNKDA